MKLSGYKSYISHYMENLNVTAMSSWNAHTKLPGSAYVRKVFLVDIMAEKCKFHR